MSDTQSSQELLVLPEASGYTSHDRELVIKIWDYARTARMCELYYGQRGVTITRLNLVVELAIAVAASGSGISGLTLFQQGWGAFLWPWLAAATAFLAIAKPLIALDRKIRHSTQQQQAYRRLLSSLEHLAFDIEQAGNLTGEHWQRFARSRELMRQTEEQDDGTASESQLAKFQARVNREMPPEQLWLPPASAEPHAA